MPRLLLLQGHVWKFLLALDLLGHMRSRLWKPVPRRGCIDSSACQLPADSWSPGAATALRPKNHRPLFPGSRTLMLGGGFQAQEPHPLLFQDSLPRSSFLLYCLQITFLRCSSGFLKAAGSSVRAVHSPLRILALPCIQPGTAPLIEYLPLAA